MHATWAECISARAAGYELLQLGDDVECSHEQTCTGIARYTRKESTTYENEQGPQSNDPKTHPQMSSCLLSRPTQLMLSLGAMLSLSPVQLA